MMSPQASHKAPVPTTPPPNLTRHLAIEIVVKNPEVLAAYFRCMPSDKQREFFQIQGGAADKILFLMRWGAYENGIPLNLVQ